jgi:hypothetical protein
MREIAIDERSVMGALDVDECLVLLRWETIGRLAYAQRGEPPIVVPVNFVLVDDDIIFRSHDGPKLDAIREQPVSLQADRYHWYQRTGWSVLVRGVAHEFLADETTPNPEPWGPGSKDHWLRLVPTAITGAPLTAPFTSAVGRPRCAGARRRGESRAPRRR